MPPWCPYGGPYPIDAYQHVPTCDLTRRVHNTYCHPTPVPLDYPHMYCLPSLCPTHPLYNPLTLSTSHSPSLHPTHPLYVSHALSTSPAPSPHPTHPLYVLHALSMLVCPTCPLYVLCTLHIPCALSMSCPLSLSATYPLYVLLALSMCTGHADGVWMTCVNHQHGAHCRCRQCICGDC